ncbi:MAG TPA: DUF115 domain-containing protein [bacterium]|nr:DUF115 domain-containing protein [bacterium]HQP99075.1 DUF115 domain-containing protein [bacterium]
METTILDENLAILQGRNPVAAEELAACCSGESPAEAKVPLPKVGEGSGGVDRSPRVILLGLGSGHDLPGWWEKAEKGTELLLIFEEDIRHAKDILSRVRLVSLLADDRVHFFPGVPAMELRRTLYPFRYLLGTVMPCLIGPDASGYRSTLEEELLLIRQNADLAIYAKGRTLFNAIRNLPAILTATPVRSLKGRCAGEPAFVVGAGPSLDRNIALLKQARDLGWVIAVDTALTPLRNAGVSPQILVTFDPTALNERHFPDWPDMGDTLLAFHPEVHSEIPRRYLGKARLLCLDDGENQLLRHLRLSPPGEGLPRAAMTGHLAFNLAVLLGCDPIVLVGMDLAFPNPGGKTHASSTALTRVVQSADAGKATIAAIPGLAEAMQTELVELPGVDGHPVYAPPMYLTYLRLMEQEFSRYNRTILDTTEGGTLKAHTQPVSLREALRMIRSGRKPPCCSGKPPTPMDRPPVADLVQKLNTARQTWMDLKAWSADEHTLEEWREHLQRDSFGWLRQAYEFLLYEMSRHPNPSDPSYLQREFRKTGDCYDLLLYAASEELSRLSSIR